MGSRELCPSYAPTAKNPTGVLYGITRADIMVTLDNGVSPMPEPLQLPDGTVVLSNRFGHGPFFDCQSYVRVVLPQGVEIEGIYNAARGARRERYMLYAFALWNGHRSHTIGMRWAPTEKGAKAIIASLARTIMV